MNAFADTLFTLLFGWIRTGVQAVWNSVTQGSLAGFFTWMGDHWLIVAAVLCLAFTALDYLVWLVRWRPYLVWKTRMRGLVHRLRGGGWKEERRFEKGYEGGIDLSAPAWQPPAADAPDGPPEGMEPEDSGFFPEAQPAFSSGAAQDFPENREAFPYEAAYAPPQEDPLASQPAAWEGAGAGQRAERVSRRRSRKHEKSAASRWQERLLANSDGEGMVDGLAPDIRKEEAFHAPVYPEHADSPYAAWQPPSNHGAG